MARGVLRTTCRTCDRQVDEVGTLSARGKCAYCAERRQVENTRDLRAHSGPRFHYWRARMAAAIGAELVVRERPSSQD